MSIRLHREVERLKQEILNLVAEVEENLRNSVEAFAKLDPDLARKVIESDPLVDQKEVDLEEECLKILALYQPVAIDLRFIIAVLKINSDLERISDMAVNIAERAEFLFARKRNVISFDFNLMSEKVQGMLRKSINSLIKLDVNLSYEVCAEDNEIDAMNREMYTAVKNAILKNPDDVEIILNFLVVSRNLERIADHATNIAEDIIYMIEGDIMRHHVKEHINNLKTL
jgi:phosphate transport system protein